MSKLAKALSGAAGNAAGDPLYVEDVFSTYLYTGTASAITINNGLDLSGEGGLTWLKSRSLAEGHILVDTINGAGTGLISSGLNALFTLTDGLTAFNSNGFTLGTSNIINTNASTNVSWSFRKAPKFFDIQTWSGNDSANRQLSHNLGSVPGMMIVKKTTGTYNWQIYHVSNGNTKFMEFGNFRVQTSIAVWNDTTPTDSVFTVGNEYGVNQSGSDYIAYLFASDAGGYGDDGTENIVKCGTVTTDGSGNASVDVGFEPQWCLWKCIDLLGGNEHGNWRINDVMRGWPVPDASNAFGYPSTLYPNTNGAETISGVDGFVKSTTGFGFGQVQANKTYIYMAIRRPMKTPTVGTEVFAIGQGDGDADIPDFISNFPVDAGIIKRITAGDNGRMSARLTGENYLSPNLQQAESGDNSATFDFMNGWGSDGTNKDSSDYSWMFKRAAGFMDVVAYSGTGSAPQNVTHNLTVTPEIIILKYRDGSTNWYVYHSALGNTKAIYLDSNGAPTTSAVFWNDTSPTATQFTLGSFASGSGQYIAYLWATLAGVSKVGTYTGTGADLNVDCGFTGGARFILIKRTDSSGDWYVWDSLRGISAGNDPYLLLNTTAAQVTNTDYVDPLNAGFTVTSNASSTVNVNGGSYIFLAIA